MLLVVGIAVVWLLWGMKTSTSITRSESDRAGQGTLVKIDPTHLGGVFAPGAIGLSVEADELATGDLSADHRSLVALMRRLGPGILRLGGNSLDYAWWTSHDESPPTWATSVIAPFELVGLRRLLLATGWRAILGVDLGHFDPDRAANETEQAQRILGSRLLGIEIGNEPNDYGRRVVGLRPSSYSPSNYLGELSAYRAAIRVTAPEVRLYGPDLAGSDLDSQVWLTAIASMKKISFTQITQHYYPTSYNVSKGACKGSAMPSALDLLSPEARGRENLVLQAIMHAGNVDHRPVRISETNTTSSCDVGGGPATSPVFASALWALDWALRAASAGVTGLNFHGYFGRCAPNVFSPICAPSNLAASKGHVIARPEYYGLLAASKLEGGRFIATSVSEQTTPEGITVYATTHSNGALTIAVDNLSATLTPVTLTVPGYRSANAVPLAAPSISATSGVTLGHASFNANGALHPDATSIPMVAGAVRIDLAPTSAMILVLHR